MSEANKNQQPLVETNCLCEECIYHIRRHINDDDHHYCKYGLYPHIAVLANIMTYQTAHTCPIYIDRNTMAHDDRSIRRLRSFSTILLERIKAHPEEFAIQFLGLDDFPDKEPRNLNFIEKYFYNKIKAKNNYPKK